MKRGILCSLMILLMSIMFITGPGRFPAGAVRAEEIQQSLPTVRIHIEGGQDEINMMNSSPDQVMNVVEPWISRSRMF